jgi:hypothetical protein
VWSREPQRGAAVRGGRERKRRNGVATHSPNAKPVCFTRAGGGGAGAAATTIATATVTAIVTVEAEVEAEAGMMVVADTEK